MTKPKILIVDDEKMTRDAMCRALGHAYDCLSAADPEIALRTLEANPDTALLITDYKMPVMNGEELISRAKAKYPNLGAILITAFGEIDLAVEAMKRGADDFITKPITDLAALETRIAQAIKVTALEKRVADLESQLKASGGLDAFTGSSPAMEKVYALIRKIAPSSASVLIEGASGTGKELVAKALHDLSPRHDGPFVAVECSALSKDLIESELFGYEAGSFTGGLREGKIGKFEAAQGGTLFLDEIGEIDLPTQVKLLRVLETRKITRVGSTKEISVDFRLIAATNRNLREMVAAKTFRDDLYYRLNVIDIPVPPLRDRPGDVALLVARFIREFAKKNASGVTGIEPDALRALERYDWPGNVRQLRNVVERMVVLASGTKLTTADLPDEIANPGRSVIAPYQADDPPAGRGRSPSGPLSDPSGRAATPSPPLPSTSALNLPSPPTSLADAEKQRILAAIEEAGGNITRAALALGVSRRTLHRKLNAWKSQA